jgi:hypothetical protein
MVFFCVFLALCFFSPVALAFAAPSSVSDDGGVAVVAGAAASNGRERDAQVTVVSPFYADAQASPFFLSQRCSETSRGRRWQEAEEE